MACLARVVLPVLMLLVMGAPLAHTLLVRRDPLGPLASPRLGKIVFPLEPEWTLAGWLSGDFQVRADRWFSNVVEPRGWVIPLTNQLLYAAFAKSYMGDRTIVIGRQGELYQGTYIEGYCRGDNLDDARELAAAAAQAGRLNERLASQGTALLVLVTPGKAAMLPERLPLGSCRPAGDPSARRRHFVAELRASGVAVLDGHALVAAMKAEDPLPPFPRGGIHWSRVVGARVAGVVMREAARPLQADLGGVDVRNVRWDAWPEKSDRDLAELLTLFAPPLDYRVAAADVACRPAPPGPGRTLVTVGGSFLYQILDPIHGLRPLPSGRALLLLRRALPALARAGDRAPRSRHAALAGEAGRDRRRRSRAGRAPHRPRPPLRSLHHRRPGRAALTIQAR